MKKHTFLSAAALSVGLSAILVSTSASAADIMREDIATAASQCQPATYTVTQVRVRPGSMRNESPNGIYISCSNGGDYLSSRGGYHAGVHVANNGTSTATVNCTLVDGYTGSETPYPKSISLAAGASSEIQWDSETLKGAGQFWKVVNYSCLLQPNIQINYLYRFYDENVGA